MIEEKYKRSVDDILNDNIYDMMDEFSTEDIYNIIEHNYPTRSKMMQTVDILHGTAYLGDTENTKKYSIKINNNRHHSTLSLSNDCETAVSESMYYIFIPNKHDQHSEIENFLSMLNEAWYTLNS